MLFSVFCLLFVIPQNPPKILQLPIPSILDASRNELPVQVLNDEEGDEEIKQIRFIPEIVGDHEITIKVNGMEVTGSPFICRVHDPARIKVGDIPHGVLNKPVHFVGEYPS